VPRDRDDSNDNGADARRSESSFTTDTGGEMLGGDERSTNDEIGSASNGTCGTDDCRRAHVASNTVRGNPALDRLIERL